MLRTMIAGLLALTPLLAASDTAKPARMFFRSAGFSMEPLEGPAGAAGYIPVMMFMPSAGGFAANVNVMIQAHSGTMDEYIASTRSQCEAAGFKILKESRSPKDEVTLEWTGQQQGKGLHWYIKAAAASGKLYQVSATSSEDQWPQTSKNLQSCVDSFKLEPIPGASSQPASGPASSQASKSASKRAR
jgi:hypothetical protein